MEIKFDKQHEETFKEIAKHHGMDEATLKERYCGMIYNKFFDDICEIANENDNYSGGYYEQD